MTPEQQQKLEAGIDDLTSQIWAFSEELYDDAMNCNTGQEPCERGTAGGAGGSGSTASSAPRRSRTILWTSSTIFTTGRPER